MARVHYRTARKAYPEQGIEKGQKYYYAKIKTGPRSSRVIRSLTKPRPSQLTVSSFLGQLGDLREDLQNANEAEDFRAIAETLREMQQECEASLDNMPDGLRDGDTGQLLQERIDGCEAFAEACDEAADTLETALDEIENMEADDLDLDDDASEDEIEEAREAKREEAREEARSTAEGGDNL